MTDRRATADALDAELARRVDAEGRMAAALVELESHPGHRMLSTVALTGQTATRWDAAREILTGLWRDFGTYRAAVAAAHAVRHRRTRPGDRELAQLRHLLLEPSIEVAKTVVPLSERRLTGTAESTETITLEQLSARMEASFRQVSEMVVSCDELHQSFLISLGPLAGRAQAVRELAGDLLLADADPAAAAVATLTTKIDDLSRACASDPLSLAGTPTAEVLAALDTELTAVSAQLAGLAALRDCWENQLAQLVTALDEIGTLREQEAHARRRAQESIADTGLTAPPDRLPALRERLAALRSPAGWSARAAALARLRAAANDAAAELRAAYERATGLQDRRAELRGRFEAYRAKAIRLGHAEHPDALSLDDDLRRLLWTRPCDLTAATRALAAYQQLTQTASGRGTGTPA